MRVSWSKLRTWRRCHARYNYKYEENLMKKKPALPLLRGKIIGECLDLVALRRGQHSNDHWTNTLAEYATKYRHLFLEEKEIYGNIIDEVYQLISTYDKLYKDDGLTYLKGLDQKPYEIKVELELMPGVEFIGYIDKLPQDSHGRIFVMDHKSHKTLPDEDARFSDLQLVFYVWACRQISELPNPDGVIWDYLRTKPPAIPEKLKSGELTQRANIDTTWEVYHQAILDNKLDPKNYSEILNRLKKEGHSAFYRRVTLPAPSKAMIESVVNDAKITAQEIIYLGGKSKVRSMDRTCKSCEFYALCHAELRGLDADFIRKSEYQPRKGDYHDGEETESENDDN